MRRRKYLFQTDWLSHSIPIWEKYLKPFKGKPNMNFLEIGSFEGRSTIWLLENILTSQSSKITCIDTFNGSPENIGKDYDISALEKTFMYNIKLSGAGNKVNVLKGFSRDFLPKLQKKSFDFVYIDGSHKATDVLEDAILSFRLTKKYGIIVFDDYEWKMAKSKIDRPRIAIDYFLEIYKGQYEFLHKGYQVIIEVIV